MYIHGMIDKMPTDIDQTALIERLKEYRLKNGLSFHSLSAAMRVSPTSLQLWFNNDRVMHDTTKYYVLKWLEENDSQAERPV